MNLPKFLLVSVLVMSAAAGAQQSGSSPTAASCGDNCVPGRTVTLCDDSKTTLCVVGQDVLQRRHISVDQASLVAALRDSDRGVREEAADKLAAQGAKDAIPAITDALILEKGPGARVNLASSLAALGSNLGFAVLGNTCGDSNVSAFTRMNAARNLLILGDQRCLNATLAMLQPESAADAKVQAFSTLAGYKHLSENDSQRILDLVTVSLSDPAAEVRIAASRAAGDLENSAAIPYLQNAAAAEHDQDVRLQLQHDLNKLRENQNKQPN